MNFTRLIGEYLKGDGVFGDLLQNKPRELRIAGHAGLVHQRRISRESSDARIAREVEYALQIRAIGEYPCGDSIEQRSHAEQGSNGSYP
jgi:hypothetical protein